MSEYRVSSRYAKSLIGLAREKDVLEQVKNDMDLFQNTVEESRDLQLMLKSPVISHYTKAGILKQIFSGKLSEMSEKFLDIVCRKARESLLPSIAIEFLRQYDLIKGIQKAKVISAVELTSEMEEQLLKKVEQLTGKVVQLETEIDESLISGYILQIGDKQVDDSVKGRLEDLKSELLA
jgi:F-type H+-transporting ATPase subunit delta